jgi:hypothetical protein
MPTIYEAKFDGSNGVRYFHIPLVRLYLDQAHKNAMDANITENDNPLASSITAIVFSAMAIEAFINQVSEDVIDKEELNKFFHLRKPYQIKDKEGSICAKYRILFEKRFNYELEEEVKSSIRSLIELRNNLVHYKLTELSGKFIMPPVKHTPTGDGGMMSTIDFMVEPERVEPPFLTKVNSAAAVEGFNTAYSAVSRWGAMLGVEDYVPGLQRIA